MELGLNFDDLYFQEDKKIKKQTPISYNAKRCSFLWFENVDVESTADELQVLKFSADFHFCQQDFYTAAQKYKRALDLLPEHNTAMYQDISESIARCYVKNGNLQKAVDVAQNLYSKAIVPSHQTRFLILLLQIYTHCHMTEARISILHQLLGLHPLNHQFWMQLAECYSLASSSEQEKSAQGTPSQVITANQLKSLTSLLCARILLKFTTKTTGSFVKSTHENLQQKIEDDIELLHLDENTLLTATEEKTNGCLLSTKDFETKWFSWTKQVL